MKNKTIVYIGIAFTLLFAASLYRYLCVKYIPQEMISPFVLYVVYIFLIAAWLHSLKTRMMQRYMLHCIKIESYVMCFWVTVRLLQETVFYNNIHLMRVSGYFVVFPTLVTVIFGCFAAFGLGKNEDYKGSKNGNYLLIPGFILVALMLTNEYHHIVFKVLPGEEENLYFHANYGFVLILLFSIALIMARIVVIYKQTKNLREGKLRKMLPVLFGIAMPLVVLQGILSSFVIEEIIELTAKCFFLEAMMWESCIYAGLVPVNTMYGLVFEYSTVGMRIIDREGNTICKNQNARELDGEELNMLLETGELRDCPDYPVFIQEMSNDYLVYQNDVTLVNRMIHLLDAQASELKQESELLAQEIHSKSEQASIDAKNRIYNSLSNELEDKLDLMEKILSGKVEDDKQGILRMLCVLGTYIKRRCNLRLIYQDEVYVKDQDFYLSLEDIRGCLNEVGIDSELIWEPETEFTVDFVINTIDELERVLEKNGFWLRSVNIKVKRDAEIRFVLMNGEATTSTIKDDLTAKECERIGGRDEGKR